MNLLNLVTIKDSTRSNLQKQYQAIAMRHTIDGLSMGTLLELLATELGRSVQPISIRDKGLTQGQEYTLIVAGEPVGPVVFSGYLPANEGLDTAKFHNPKSSLDLYITSDYSKDVEVWTTEQEQIVWVLEGTDV